MNSFSLLCIKKTKYIFTFVCVYFLIAWTNYFLNIRVVKHPLDLYFGLSFICFPIIGFLLLRREKLSFYFREFDWRELSLSSLLILIFVITRYIKFPEMGIWLDEYTQFSIGNVQGYKDTIDLAFRQQQPPLDYILHGFAGTMIGYSPFALKVHASLFALLFLLIVPHALSYLSESLWVRWIPSFLLLLSNPLIAYSIEGRPLMLALFCAMVFMMMALDYLEKGRGVDSSFCWIVLTGWVFLNTTGLQPQLFIFFLLCVLAIISIFKGDRSKAGLLLGSGFICFLYQIPISYYLIALTEETYQFHSHFLEQFLRSLKFTSLKKVGEIYNQDILLIKVMGAVSLFGLIPNIFKRDTRKIGLFIFPFIFLFGYFIIYSTFISWNFAIRYVYCSYAGIAFILGIALCELERLKSRFCKTAVFFILSTIILYGGYKNVTTPIVNSVVQIIRPDWQGLYSYLNNEMTKNDFVMRVSTAEYGDWRQIIYVGDYLYANEVVLNQILRPSNVETWDFSTFFYVGKNIDYKKTRVRNLYYIFLPNSVRNHFQDISTSNAKLVKKFHLIDLYKIEVNDSLYEGTKSFYLQLIKKFPSLEATIPFYESLLMLELMFSEERTLFDEVLSKYAEIKLRKGARTLNGTKYPKINVHSQRIEFFKGKGKAKWK